jgi:hypothetical protein
VLRSAVLLEASTAALQAVDAVVIALLRVAKTSLPESSFVGRTSFPAARPLDQPATSSRAKADAVAETASQWVVGSSSLPRP